MPAARFSALKVRRLDTSNSDLLTRSAPQGTVAVVDANDLAGDGRQGVGYHWLPLLANAEIGIRYNRPQNLSVSHGKAEYALQCAFFPLKRGATVPRRLLAACDGQITTAPAYGLYIDSIK